jgi:hypothetical protein
VRGGVALLWLVAIALIHILHLAQNRGYISAINVNLSHLF